MFFKSDILNLLEEKDIEYVRADHPEAHTMEELKAVDLPYPDRSAKNVFVHDRKKRHYFLVTVMGDKRVDLQQIREAFGTSRLSFASDEDLQELLGVQPGSVSPFALLNDQDQKVQYVLDQSFLEGNEVIAAHPNENTMSLYLNVHDLISLIEETDHSVKLMDIE